MFCRLVDLFYFAVAFWVLDLSVGLFGFTLFVFATSLILLVLLIGVYLFWPMWYVLCKCWLYFDWLVVFYLFAWAGFVCVVGSLVCSTIVLFFIYLSCFFVLFNVYIVTLLVFYLILEVGFDEI